MEYNPFYNIENPELIGYEYAWVHFLKGNDMPGDIMPSRIVHSWIRSRKAGVDPVSDTLDQRAYVPGGEITLENIHLVNASHNIIDSLCKAFEGSDLHICIVDTQRNILMDTGTGILQQDPRVKVQSKREDLVGTNAADMALRIRKPCSIVGAQHYSQCYHSYACYAAPIIVDADLLGSIAISVPCESMNAGLLAMADSAALNIVNQIMLMRQNDLISSQDKEKMMLLDTVTDIVLYVNEGKSVTFANEKLCQLLGMKRNEIIGRDMDFVETDPPLSALYEKNAISDEQQVILRGRYENYSCFLTQKNGRRKEDERNRIFIFKVIDEIQDLAEKANASNKAYFTMEDIIGSSSAMRETVKMAKKVAMYDVRVILEGESGTGKEVFAQSIHNLGARRSGPFVAVDCGAIPRELIESELFGYEGGAFTGARRSGSRGKFELANKGTLFLDEIENLPLDMQSKLLRVLQEQCIVKVGGTKSIPIDAQIIAATNKDLRKEIDRGAFREDLYYRLNVMHITIPPLRERKEDIPALIEHSIWVMNQNLHKNIKGIDDEALALLASFPWPGNVRQLNNAIERMMILCEGDSLTSELIPEDLYGRPEEAVEEASQNLTKSGSIHESEIVALKTVENRYIKLVLEHYQGNIKRTAEKLGISRSKLYRILEKDGAKQ
ncbi:MAG: sigma 54-interacting transcriptional regulator [Eubacteriales bacterium]|nr:sigma 54-interacting transcriptional regulator [Eubacteriales bacterium]